LLRAAVISEARNCSTGFLARKQLFHASASSRLDKTSFGVIKDWATAKEKSPATFAARLFESLIADKSDTGSALGGRLSLRP
ncbi:MAG: hypothetical protein ACOVLH_17885, partial [Roseateles sp.]